MLHARTPCGGTRLTVATSDGPEVTSSSLSAEVLLVLFRAAKSSLNRIGLCCSSALHCSLVCERPGPWYRRAGFIGDYLAVQNSLCSCAAEWSCCGVAPA